MLSHQSVLVALALLVCAPARSDRKCSTLAWTETGWVCGVRRAAQDGSLYASFRGVPYAKQPLGELRFQELQPAEPWKDILDASTEGPVCSRQHNLYYGSLMAPRGESEACIHANIHVPLEALPRPGHVAKRGLPILVYYPGGGWISGSGDGDMNGPEYLVGKGIIVITFNYRLDVFGFLSLGTAKIPGNNGLRDAVTLLRWVQRNAAAFGGDPDEVTLAGQSAGAVNAGLLALSPVTKGLFKRLWLMSGVATAGFYTTSPVYAEQIATKFLTLLGLNGTDYDSVHDQLVRMPIEQINNASDMLLQGTIGSFQPVQESALPGVTTIISDNPRILLANGYGDDIPMVIGFTSNESQIIYSRLNEIDILGQIEANPSAVLLPDWIFTLSEEVQAVVAEKIIERYLGDDPTLQNYISYINDGYYKYPGFKLAGGRAARGGAPVYLYKFSYEADHSALKVALNISYSGATHAEDLTNILKINSIPVPPSARDDSMKDWMSTMMANFVKTGRPADETSWPAQEAGSLRYQHIEQPQVFRYAEASSAEQDMYDFFEGLPTQN